MSVHHVWLLRVLLSSALVLTACSSDTDIIGHCESITEPGLLLSGDNGSLYTWWSPSVGLLDDHVWVTYVQMVGDKWLGLGRWYDAATLVPTSAPVRLGTVDIWQLQNWVRDGGSLVGQVWADPAEPVEIASDDGLVHLWRVTPPPMETADGRRVALTTAVPPPGGFGRFRTIGLGVAPVPGLQGALPMARLADTVLGVFAAVVPCDDGLFGNNRGKLHVFGLELHAESLPFPSAACNEAGAANPWLVDVGGGVAGLLFRFEGPSSSVIRYVSLNSDGTPISTPRVVGGGANVAVTDDTGGFQPRAVRVGDHILFTERRGTGPDCYTIRVMDLDGDNAADAPWQLPCAADGGYADGPVVTWIHQLLHVPGAGVLVWQERTNVSGGIITNPASYREGVFAVMLTQEGKRGSAVMRLTTDDFTAAELDPDGTPIGANDTDVQAAADGNNIFATWIDRRSPDAPAPIAGYHARMIRCAVDP